MANLFSPRAATADPAPPMPGAATPPLPGAVVWEFEERTKTGWVGWAAMDAALSAELEAEYLKDPHAILRIERSTTPFIVWKIDLGKKTQRRLVEGVDDCSRRVRRIYLTIDVVGEDDGRTDADAQGD